MEKIKIKYIVYIAILLVLGMSVVTVIAQNNNQPSDVPILPAVYYGELTVGKNDVNDGLKVEAFVNGKSCGQKSETKDGMYITVVRGNDVLTPGCANSGQDVKLIVSGIEIMDAKWSSGLLIRNDINLDREDLDKDQIETLIGKEDKEKPEKNKTK